MLLFYQFALGLALSCLVACGALFLQWLSPSGTIAAIISGTLIITIGPWYSIFLVGFFFASSGAISLFKHQVDRAPDDPVNKGHKRDMLQVWANIFPSLFVLLLYRVLNNDMFLLAFIAGIASCTSDTWGSDIGVLSRKPPRDLLTGKKLAPGLSGGVSLLGTCTSLAGSAAIIGLYTISLWLSGKPIILTQLILLVALGFLGSLVDSLLGATIQVRYQCLVCGQYTEKKIHHQQATRKVSGLAFVSNEGVNFLSNLLIVVITLLLFK